MANGRMSPVETSITLSTISMLIQTSLIWLSNILEKSTIQHEVMDWSMPEVKKLYSRGINS